MLERGLILADAGGLIALLDNNDAHHPACVRAVALLHGKLLTTPYAFGEAMHLLGRELGRRGHIALWQLVTTGVLEVVAQGASERMRHLMEQYRDLPMDLADASLVVLAEELDVSSILSFDADFRVYRRQGSRPLTVVP